MLQSHLLDSNTKHFTASSGGVERSFFVIKNKISRPLLNRLISARFHLQTRCQMKIVFLCLLFNPDAAVA